MRAHWHIGHNGFLHQVGALVFAAGVFIRAEVRVGPAVEAAFFHAREVVGHQLVAQLVALVYGRPQRAGAGVVGQPDRVAQAAGTYFLARAIGINFENIGAALLVFGAVFEPEPTVTKIGWPSLRASRLRV